MIIQPPALMDFQRNFIGADNASDIGADWRSDHDNMKRITNRAQQSTPASNTGRQGAWETFVPAADYNGGRLLTDNWLIEMLVVSPVGSQALDNVSSIGCCMLDAGPGSGMVLVYASFLQGAVSGTGMAIYTYSASSIASPGHATTMSGQTNNMTVRGAATATNRAANSDVMGLRRTMYSATQSKIELLQNGTVRDTFDDSGGVVPAGNPYKRRAFCQTEANFPIFSSAFYSIAHSVFRARDRRVP